GVQLSSLSRWLKRARQPNGLDARPIPGPPCKLSTDQLQKLEELLAAGAVKHGWANNLWTPPPVAQVLERHLGVRYNPGHVCRILKTALNWTCQRPQHHHKDRDDGAIQTWIKETFPRIAQAADARGAHLTFIDDAGFMLEPTVRRTYAPRGKP